MKPPPDEMKRIHEQYVIDAIRQRNVESLDLCGGASGQCGPIIDERGIHWAHTLQDGCAFASGQAMLNALADYLQA